MNGEQPERKREGVVESETWEYLPGTPMAHTFHSSGYCMSAQELVLKLKTWKGTSKRSAARLLGVKRDVRTVDALIEVLDSRDAMLRAYAAESLGKIGSARRLGAQVVPRLLPLLRDPSPSVRERTVVALGLFDEPEVDAILQLVDDPNWRVRGVVAWILGNVKSEKALTALRQLAEDPRPTVRAMVVHALRRFGGGEALDLLFDLLVDRSNLVQKSTHQVIWRVNNITSADVLPHLKNSDWRKRAKACLLLGHIKGDAAGDALVAMLKDEHYRVRKEVVVALRLMRDPQTVLPLIEALDDSVQLVRDGALDALVRIGDPAFEVIWRKLQSGDFPKRSWKRSRMRRILSRAESRGWKKPTNSS